MTNRDEEVRRLVAELKATLAAVGTRATCRHCGAAAQENDTLCEKCDDLPRCLYCGGLVDAEEATPYCGPECAARAAAESED